jgi:flagellar protein FlgJ
MFSRERASFRSYDTFEDSFTDYVNFIQGSGRYRDALESAHDNKIYTQKLAQAGYATDPNYANKIIRILDSDHLKDALSSVKL